MPKKFIRSFKFASAGAEHAIRTQRNLWIHFFIGLAVLAAAVWLKVSLVELAVLVLAIFGVIVNCVLVHRSAFCCGLRNGGGGNVICRRTGCPLASRVEVESYRCERPMVWYAFASRAGCSQE